MYGHGKTSDDEGAEQDSAARDAQGVDRRTFLCWTACASAAGAVGLGASGVLAERALRVELNAWRVRPGARVALEAIAAAPGADAKAPLRLHVVEVDARGEVIDRISGVTAAARGDGRWEAEVVAPSRPGAGESYLLAVAWSDERGRAQVSNAVEVICAVQCPGG